MRVSTMFAQRDATVRRGYRLHLTNLEDRALTYQLRFWVTPPDAVPHWAAALNEFFGFYAGLSGIDFHSTGGPFVRTAIGIYAATQTFEVQPNRTVSVGYSPSGTLDLSKGIHILEGYVTLQLPVLRVGLGDVRFRPTPQADRPVKVLLNPEMTMLHIDTQGAGFTQDLDGVVTGRVSVTHLNFDTVEPMVPASGKAENDITPDGINLLSQTALIDLLSFTAMTEEGASSSLTSHLLSPEDRMGALVELLCELDANKDFVSAFNNLLAKNHAAARICSDPKNQGS